MYILCTIVSENGYQDNLWKGWLNGRESLDVDYQMIKNILND